MKKITISLACLAFVSAGIFLGCAKPKKVVTFNHTVSTDIPVNLTSVAKWGYVEFSATSISNIGNGLDAQGVTGDHVGSMIQKSITVTVKNPSSSKIQDFTCFGNYEFWMSTPAVAGHQCINKSDYWNYITYSNSNWSNYNCPVYTGTVLTGTTSCTPNSFKEVNYKAYVIEPSYNLKMKIWMNGNTPPVNTLTLTIAQTFEVKAIK
jgi:hypothetical protein